MKRSLRVGWRLASGQQVSAKGVQPAWSGVSAVPSIITWAHAEIQVFLALLNDPKLYDTALHFLSG